MQFTLIKVLFTLLDCFINYPKLVRVFNLNMCKRQGWFIVYCPLLDWWQQND